MLGLEYSSLPLTRETLVRCELAHDALHRTAYRSASLSVRQIEIWRTDIGRSWLPLEGKLSSEARLMRCAVQCRVSVDFRRIRSAFPPHPSRLCRDTFPSRGRLWNAPNSNLPVCLVSCCHITENNAGTVTAEQTAVTVNCLMNTRHFSGRGFYIVISRGR